LTLKGSAFSWLWLQSSHIGGTLELNNTEARCAYHIKASNIGYVTADQAGFGIVKTSAPTKQHPALDYAWWNRAVPPNSGKPGENKYAREMFDSSPIKSQLSAMEGDILPKIDNATMASKPAIFGCQETDDGISAPTDDLEFLIADTTIHAALCLTSFEWTVPKSDIPDTSQPATIVAFRETKIDGSLILHLWDDKVEKRYNDALQSDQKLRSIAQKKNRFEAVGLKAGVFVFNFSEVSKPYSNYLDGLNFTRIQDALSPACDRPAEELGKASLASQFDLPDVDIVMRWLDTNEAKSSQPYTVFVQIFEQAGQDATDLRVNRANFDLHQKWIQRSTVAATPAALTSDARKPIERSQWRFGRRKCLQRCPRNLLAFG
jgi:hypothetical protein